MSKRLKTIYHFAFLAALILQIFNNSHAQAIRAKIKITGANAFVEGDYTNQNDRKNATHLSFLKSYANVENLGARISDVKLVDPGGRAVDYKKLADGEFLAAGEFRSWSHKIDLSASENVSARAHVSWLTGEQGILMLGDLLPEFSGKTSGMITIELPAGWRAASVENRSGENVFEVADVERAVFYVGKNLREREVAAGAARMNLVMAGEWQVTDEEAARFAQEIFAFYEKMFGGRSFEKYQIFLGKFPAEVKAGRWEAETRGASATILSSEMSFRSQSVQRLHEQLRHEIFHFWLPNGVNLSGNYDWFYEGFALYASLKTAVAMKRIRFEDYLDTLSRAHSIDSRRAPKSSLVEASKKRWNGANTQVYARGMLVGFLVDVALLRKSNGKSSLGDVLRDIYRKHNSMDAAPADGNAAILGALQNRPELLPIVERYVKGTETIAWQTELAAIGIELATDNFSTKLTVTNNPKGRQKDLLEKLGYNNWRK